MCQAYALVVYTGKRLMSVKIRTTLISKQILQLKPCMYVYVACSSVGNLLTQLSLARRWSRIVESCCAGVASHVHVIFIVYSSTCKLIGVKGFRRRCKGDCK